MPTTYVGTPAFNQSITIPVDGDPADAASVNTSAQDELDTQLYLFESYGRLMQSTSPIRARFVNFFDIQIQAIPFIAVTEGGTWKTVFTTGSTTIGLAELEGGGTYNIDTWYYVYAYSLAGVCKFQISAVQPDKYTLYKDGTFSMKFICSFRTTSTILMGSATIYPFTKWGGYVSYESQIPVGGGAANVFTLLGTQSYIPPLASFPGRMCKLSVDVANISSVTTSTISLTRDINLPGISINYKGAESTVLVDVPTDDQRNVFYKTNLTGIATCTISIVGYYE